MNASILGRGGQTKEGAGDGRSGVAVVIRISIEQTQPLRGMAQAENGAPVAFEGWMEFLGAVSELLGVAPADESRIAAEADEPIDRRNRGT